MLGVGFDAQPAAAVPFIAPTVSLPHVPLPQVSPQPTVPTTQTVSMEEDFAMDNDGIAEVALTLPTKKKA